MNDDDTCKTVAQLHGLDVDDPWDRRSEKQKATDLLRVKFRDDAVLQRQRDAEQPQPVFVDPPDDEGLWIRADDPAGRMFYRLAVADLKLSDLLKLEISLFSIGAAARNRLAGCWVAVTSRRVGIQVAERLRAHGLSVELTAVSSDGQPILIAG